MLSAAYFYVLLQCAGINFYVLIQCAGIKNHSPYSKEIKKWAPLFVNLWSTCNVQSSSYTLPPAPAPRSEFTHTHTRTHTNTHTHAHTHTHTHTHAHAHARTRCTDSADGLHQLFRVASDAPTLVLSHALKQLFMQCSAFVCLDSNS